MVNGIYFTTQFHSLLVIIKPYEWLGQVLFHLFLLFSKWISYIDKCVAHTLLWYLRVLTFQHSALQWEPIGPKWEPPHSRTQTRARPKEQQETANLLDSIRNLQWSFCELWNCCANVSWCHILKPKTREEILVGIFSVSWLVKCFAGAQILVEYSRFYHQACQEARGRQKFEAPRRRRATRLMTN
jgi:hypothetical protein